MGNYVQPVVISSGRGTRVIVSYRVRTRSGGGVALFKRLGAYWRHGGGEGVIREMRIDFAMTDDYKLVRK